MSDHGLNDAVKDHKRESDSKHKWALGEAAVVRGRQSIRPQLPTSSGQSRAIRAQRNYTKDNSTTRLPRKHPILETDTFVSDSSAEEDVKDASTAPEPDAEIMYSYDAPRGPAQGGQILSMALAKAVEKFETKATEKLVNDEYEVVGREKEDSQEYFADEDDFELV